MRASRLALRSERASNAEAVRELQTSPFYAAPGRIIPIKGIYVERKWLGYYGGVMAYWRDNSADSAVAHFSPDSRKVAVFGKVIVSEPHLLPDLVALDRTTTHELSVPLILFEGRHTGTWIQRSAPRGSRW